MNSGRRASTYIGILLLLSAACSKHKADPKVIVQIPAGFSGDFLLEMGVRDAPPLERQGDAYVVTVPRSGRLATSTLIANPRPVFNNSSDGGVWGYSHSVFTTGDGIPTGGKIEFFVGTKDEYDAEKNRKDHSSGLPLPDGSSAGLYSSGFTEGLLTEARSAEEQTPRS